MSFIAGPFTGTYDGTDIGITEAGFNLERVEHQQEIRGDNKGETIQDTIALGEDWFVDWVMQEYGAAAVKMLQAFQVAAAATPVLGLHSQVGQTAIGSSRAKALIFTAVAGTPAASTPATLTANKAILAPGFSSRFALTSRLRQVPIRQLLLPYTSSGERSFTLT